MLFFLFRKGGFSFIPRTTIARACCGSIVAVRCDSHAREGGDERGRACDPDPRRELSDACADLRGELGEEEGGGRRGGRERGERCEHGEWGRGIGQESVCVFLFLCVVKRVGCVCVRGRRREEEGEARVNRGVEWEGKGKGTATTDSEAMRAGLKRDGE